MYFQLEIDDSLTKLTEINIQLSVNSINKNQLKDEDQMVQGIVLATITCHTFLFGLVFT